MRQTLDQFAATLPRVEGTDSARGATNNTIERAIGFEPQINPIERVKFFTPAIRDAVMKQLAKDFGEGNAEYWPDPQYDTSSDPLKRVAYRVKIRIEGRGEFEFPMFAIFSEMSMPRTPFGSEEFPANKYDVGVGAPGKGEIDANGLYQFTPNLLPVQKPSGTNTIVGRPNAGSQSGAGYTDQDRQRDEATANTVNEIYQLMKRLT